MATYPVQNITGSVAVPQAAYVSAADYPSVQAALDANAGGCVYLPPGVYVERITLPHRTTLRGAGRSSVIKAPDASTGPTITNAPHSNFCGVFDLAIDGNKANQPAANAGLVFDNSWTYDSMLDELWDARHTAQNVFIYCTKGNGLVNIGRGDNTFIGVQILECDGHGIISGYDNHFIGCDVGYSGLCGVYIEHGSTRMVACKSWYSGQLNQAQKCGFWLRRAQSDFAVGVTLSSCEAQDNRGPGFVLDGAQHCALEGCIADSNAGVGFDLYNATENMIRGLARTRSGSNQVQSYALRMRAGSVNNMVTMISTHTPATPLEPSSEGYADNLFTVLHNGGQWGP